MEGASCSAEMPGGGVLRFFLRPPNSLTLQVPSWPPGPNFGAPPCLPLPFPAGCLFRALASHCWPGGRLRRFPVSFPVPVGAFVSSLGVNTRDRRRPFRSTAPQGQPMRSRRQLREDRDLELTERLGGRPSPAATHVADRGPGVQETGPGRAFEGGAGGGPPMGVCLVDRHPGRSRCSFLAGRPVRPPLPLPHLIMTLLPLQG